MNTPNPYSIRTRSGRYLDFQNPDPKDIVLEDIAVALSRAPRFNGHTGPFFSVAQHSVYVGRLIKDVTQRTKGLLHDASEAYLADVPTPAKRLMPDYYNLETKVMSAVAKKFGLPEGFQHEDLVVQADRAMLFLERDAMISSTDVWTNEEDHPGGKITDHFPSWEPWGSEKAATIFYNEVVAAL